VKSPKTRKEFCEHALGYLEASEGDGILQMPYNREDWEIIHADRMEQISRALVYAMLALFAEEDDETTEEDA
jgi:hypothetical protein